MNNPADLSEPDTSVEKRFLASVSHEIRTPLNGILGMASLLSETDLTAAQADYVAAIRQSGARLLDLLNNVLDYARMDAAGVELEDTDVNLVQLAQEVAELLSPRAHERGLDICVRAEPGFPALMKLDDGRMRQILFNLCGNAIKFTETGGVLIDLRRKQDRLSIRVIDSGPGLSSDEQTRLFQAFGQASSDDRKRDGGVGLGLTIVQRLTEAMGGEVSLISEKGLGACFVVSLPCPETSSLPRKENRSELKPLRVGFAGISVPLILSLSQILIDAGHIPLAEPSHGDVDVWIADASLPPLRLKEYANQTPLIALIRPEDRNHLEALRDLGIAAYLMRPLRRGSLFARLNALQETGALSGDGDTSDTEDESGQGLKVLIADDNAVNALLATRILEKSGYSCVTAATGAEALELAGSQQFNLILMDLRMPVMDGFEAMRQIRALNASHAQVPMIAISAEVNPEVERKARDSGADSVASKPLDAQTLRTLASTWRRKADHA